MSGDELPVEPTFRSEIDDARVDNLESRIALLESRLEKNSLSAEDEHNQLLRHEIKQRIASRYFVLVLSVLVMSFMACMAKFVLDIYFVGSLVFISSTLATALFVAPIVSMSAITITLLIGVFRRFKHDDLQRMNTLAVIEGARNLASP